MNRKPVFTVFLLCVLALLLACVSTGSGTGLSLQDAIDQSAEKIAKELPAGSRVAIVAFETSDDNLSNYIMEELTGALFDRGIEVADRRNLEYVYREQNFQMSGDVSDETAVSIGKFLGANMVITGQLIDLGDTYRYRTSAIRMEQATRASVTRLNVRGDAETRQMVATIAQQQTVITETKYGVNEEKTPQTAGTYLDRGIMFAMRGEYDMAILDFTDAIEKDPDMAAAYRLRARALVASVAEVIDVGINFSSIEINNNTWVVVSEDDIRIYDRAIEDLTQAIRLDPDNTKTYVERGIAYRKTRLFTRAIDDLTKAIRLDPNNAKTYVERGIAYYFINRNKAIANYTQAIRLDPNLIEAYTSRGRAYLFKVFDFDLAITDYTEAIRLNPNDADAYNNRGYAYYQKGDYKQAIEDFETMLRIDPNHRFASSNLEIVRNYQQGLILVFRRVEPTILPRLEIAPLVIREVITLPPIRPTKKN